MICTDGFIFLSLVLQEFENCDVYIKGQVQNLLDLQWQNGPQIYHFFTLGMEKTLHLAAQFKMNPHFFQSDVLMPIKNKPIN